jgi:predicted nucleic acid-binding protein
MIYIDMSVVLATLLAADRVPPTSLWQETLVASRLLAIEVWVRLNGKGLAASHGELADGLLGRIAFVEMDRSVLARTHEPFPVPVRTLDAIHLATACYLREQGQLVQLATYDERMAAAARGLGQEIAAWGQDATQSTRRKEPGPKGRRQSAACRRSGDSQACGGSRVSSFRTSSRTTGAPRSRPIEHVSYGDRKVARKGAGLLIPSIPRKSAYTGVAIAR